MVTFCLTGTTLAKQFMIISSVAPHVTHLIKAFQDNSLPVEPDTLSQVLKSLNGEQL